MPYAYRPRLDTDEIAPGPAQDPVEAAYDALGNALDSLAAASEWLGHVAGERSLTAGTLDAGKATRHLAEASDFLADASARLTDRAVYIGADRRGQNAPTDADTVYEIHVIREATACVADAEASVAGGIDAARQMAAAGDFNTLAGLAADTAGAVSAAEASSRRARRLVSGEETPTEESADERAQVPGQGMATVTVIGVIDDVLDLEDALEGRIPDWSFDAVVSCTDFSERPDVQLRDLGLLRADARVRVRGTATDALCHDDGETPCLQEVSERLSCAIVVRGRRMAPHGGAGLDEYVCLSCGAVIAHESARLSAHPYSQDLVARGIPDDAEVRTTRKGTPWVVVGGLFTASFASDVLAADLDEACRLVARAKRLDVRRTRASVGPAGNAPMRAGGIRKTSSEASSRPASDPRTPHVPSYRRPGGYTRALPKSS